MLDYLFLKYFQSIDPKRTRVFSKNKNKEKHPFKMLKRGFDPMTHEDLVGRCGLYCGACSIYRADKDNGEYLIRLAKRFKCPPEKVKCEGCQILTPECWGNDCKIVQCLNANNYEFCYECPKYEKRSCKKFEELAKRYLEDNVDVRASLEKIRSGKVAEWLKESKKRFRCPYCKKPLPEGFTKCYHCKKEFPQI